MTFDGKTILIDAGESDDGSDIIKSLAACGVETIDLWIITHFDKDHIGGAAEVAASVNVSEVWLPDYTRDSKHYRNMIAAFDDNEIPYQKISENRTQQLGNATLELWVSPLAYTGEDNDDNEQSLVLAVNYDQSRLLFMGDANGGWLSKLCYGTYNLTCNLVKMPYHGRWEANMAAFVAFAAPEYAIITDSVKNPADSSTIDALEIIGTDIYQTKDGLVHLQCDGKQIIVP